MKARFWFRRLGSVLLGLVALSAVVIVVAFLLAKPAPAHSWFTPRASEHTPLVFAHQGGENLWPNNTLFAFQGAVELGADVLDTDMHMTRDGVLILMHDQTVDRTTNGAGAIRDLTLAEIKQLDAGYGFTTDDGQTYPNRGQGLMVPTLEELFQAFAAEEFSYLRYGIEIKQTDPIPTAEKFCALLRQYQMQARVLISSFRQENMDAFRAECPEVATSATEGEVRLFYVLFRVGLVGAFTPNYYSLQVPEASGGIHLLTPEFVAAAHSRGLAVQPWTIDEIEDLQRILGLGVDGINTNNPDRLLSLLSQ